jgi:hypothetical protein
VRLRHKGGSKEIVRVEREIAGGYLGDIWTEGNSSLGAACLVSTRGRIPRNMSDQRITSARKSARNLDTVTNDMMKLMRGAIATASSLRRDMRDVPRPSPRRSTI